MCRLPDAVGGGVSTLNTDALPASSAAARSNRWVPSRSQTAPHAASRPSRAGLSGMPMRELLVADVIACTPVRYARHRVGSEVPGCGSTILGRAGEDRVGLHAP